MDDLHSAWSNHIQLLKEFSRECIQKRPDSILRQTNGGRVGSDFRVLSDYIRASEIDAPNDDWPRPTTNT